MRIGMLWFDNAPKTSAEDKVRRGASYYFDKYGVRADLCYVHTSTEIADSVAHDTSKIKVTKDDAILPHHFWFGQDK